MPKEYHKVEKIVFPTSSHLNLKETNYGGNLQIPIVYTTFVSTLPCNILVWVGNIWNDIILLMHCLTFNDMQNDQQNKLAKGFYST